ncbi:MAK16-like protein [Paramicrosporidium saccamoebae]|uniref:Protein MAK16 n=1 Tax=Paramicrosporidium saccamoebae TaxID=1246581 RepID=A0A2H9TPK5_9FUNG|nr:MAK16-like protein [Paramicrosporidium saccamoebae]
MQSDDVIWQVINNGFCSFKVTTLASAFCRNENNVTGLCNKQSCPLANSRYATIREINGVCYLYKKVVERAHLPARMWEKIKLKGNAGQVEEKIQKELEYMPEFFKAKCKARYTRIQEYLRRTDRLKNDPNQPILSAKKSKVIKREMKRENRAKQVALIENAIEKELLDRLQKGVYGDIYNLPQKTFETVLEKHGQQQEMESDVEYVEGEEELEELDSDVEYLEEFEASDDELVQDLEDIVVSRAPSRRKAHVEIEYEGPSKELTK